MSPLTPRERRKLRARAHHLEPVARVGQAGISPPVVDKIVSELAIHELIKVKVGQGAPVPAKQAGPELAEATGADLVQVIGRVVVLYKERPPEEDEG
jgi:RNA-binding protein